MTRAHVEQLSLQLSRSSKRLRERTAGITDEEYLWEPVAGCWTVRPRAEAISPNPMGGGNWIYDCAWEPPSPAPFTTIAWRLTHITDVLASYRAALWGGEVSDDMIEVTPSASKGVAQWDEHAAAFLEALAQEDDAGLQRSVRVPWWPEDAPRWHVISHVSLEQIHHGAEIGLMRDLFERRDQLSAC